MQAVPAGSDPVTSLFKCRWDHGEHFPELLKFSELSGKAFDFLPGGQEFRRHPLKAYKAV